MDFISLFIHSKLAFKVHHRKFPVLPQNFSSQAFHTLHLSPPLFMSTCFRSKLYPELKSSGALISRADRRGGVDIATFDCGTLTYQENYHRGVDIATIDF